MSSDISPFVMVIFGATGDLTERKLMPALFRLFLQGAIPKRCFIVGFARRSFSHDAFRNLMQEAVKKNAKVTVEESIWQQFAQNIYYQQGVFEDKQPYKKVTSLLTRFDRELGACITRFFYLATPPQNYSEILTRLDESKLAEGCGQGSDKWTRVLIEKPFGKDMEQAKKLEEVLAKTFAERQIYRIDHYLAKETVQNILVFRFANKMFEPVWNSRYIDNIQITIAESQGVGKRGAFYEGVGALKDVAQNHLMALLAYITMEEPKTWTAASIRTERINVLRKIRCPDSLRYVVRGQYRGYRQEKNVSPDSNTETFVAMRLWIDNPRWEGMPVYVRTGKMLSRDEVRIDMQFKRSDANLFLQAKEKEHASPVPTNVLTIAIQPHEGITLRILGKKPGLAYEISPVEMDFSYSRSFNKTIADPYEKLLVDAMGGDQTLFATKEGFAATWHLVEEITKLWEEEGTPVFPDYKPGTWGPQEANRLIQEDGRQWITHTSML